MDARLVESVSIRISNDSLKKNREHLNHEEIKKDNNGKLLKVSRDLASL